jgi:hypothetical protein
MSDQGRITVNQVHILDVDAVPTTGNSIAPTGSLALREDGGGFHYFGSGNAWSQVVTVDSSGVFNVLVNDPRLSPAKTAIVQKNPGQGQFSSIKDAAAYAATQMPTPLEPWVVLVYPGRYEEDDIVIPTDVHILGLDQYAVTVVSTGTGHTFEANGPFSIGFMSIENSNPGYAGLKINNVDQYGLLHKVSFAGCFYGIDSYCDTGNINTLYLEYVDATANAGQTGFRFTAVSGSQCYVSCENFYTYGDVTNPDYGVHAVGSGLTVSTKAAAMEGVDGTGYAVVTESGANINAGVLGISNWATGVYVPQDEGSPNIVLNSTPFNLNTGYDVYIQSSGATGYMISYTPLDKQFISEANTFFMTYRKDHAVTVSQKGGDFQHIYQAIDYINTNLDPPTADHGYLILVGPGIYSEPQLTVPEFTYVQGEDQYAVRIQPTGSNDLFHIGQSTTLSFLTIQNVPVGYHGLVSTNPGDFTLIHKVAFENCHGAARVIANSGTTNVFYFEYADTTQDNTSDHGFEFISVSGTPLEVSCENFYVIAGASNPPIGVVASGSGLFLTTRASALIGVDGTGKGLEILDGARVSLPVLGISNWATGISIPEDGSAPNLRGYAVAFNENTYNISVQSSGATGFLSAYSPYLKNDINPNAPFFLANKDQHIITVAQKGGDFTSVKAALAAITDNGPTSQYVIEVGPGVFTELNPISLKPYVTVRGENASTTIINAAFPGQHLFSGTTTASLTDLTLMGTTDHGSYLLNWYEPGSNGYMSMYRVYLGATWGVAQLTPENNNSNYLACFNLTSLPLSNIKQAFTINNDVLNSGSQNAIHVQDSLFSDVYGGLTRFAVINGSGNFFQADNTIIQNPPYPAVTGSTAITAYNNSEVRLLNTFIDGFSTGISNPNTGGPTQLIANALTLIANGYDVSIEHPTSYGSLQGTFARKKTNIASPLVTTLAGDPEDFSTFSVGAYYAGPTQSSLAEVAQLWKDGSTMGLITSGTMVQLPASSGLAVKVNAGIGYLESNDVLIKQTWPTQTYTGIAAWDDVYVFVDANGNISKSSSAINGDVTKILLGRVVANETYVTSVGNISMDAHHFGNKVDEYLRDVFGGIVSNGLVISNPSGLYFDMTGGEYYYSTHKYEPAPKTNPIAFAEIYHTVAGTGIVWSGNYNLTGQINNTQIDLNSSGLTAMTSGYYAKHAMWYAGGADVLLFLYAQSEYVSFSGASLAASPTQPEYFKDAIIHIADIIVQQGSGTIIEIEDTRPTPSYKATSVVGGGGITYHNQLLGLLSDDHTQYLLVNGTRAMTGGLDMGGNSITNVNLVGGIVPSGHASRHLPNGADPLTTSTPSTIDLTNTVNDGGIANSFARSDHNHATSYVPLNTAGGIMTGGLSGTSANFTSITGTSISGTTIVGGTVTALTSSFSPVVGGQIHTGTTAVFTNITGTNITGSSVNAQTITNTTSLTSPLITATTINATSLTGNTISGTTSVVGGTINALTSSFSPVVGGQIFTGTTAVFTNITGVTLITGSTINAQTITNTTSLTSPLATITTLNATNLTGTSISGNTLVAKNINAIDTLNLSGSAVVTNGSNLGSGEPIFSGKNLNTLEFKQISGIGSVTLSSTANVLTISGSTSNIIITGTAPILVTGSTIGIGQSTSTTDGYLTSTDWNRFQLVATGSFVHITGDAMTGGLNGTSAKFATITGTTSISGVSILGQTANITSITGNIISGTSFLGQVASITSITGNTISGTSFLGQVASFGGITGTTISGTAILGQVANITSITGNTLTANASLTLGSGANIVVNNSGTSNIGSVSSTVNVLFANEISGVNARGYAYSYDTTTQTVSVANSFQDITFNTNVLLDGWTHTAGGTLFTGTVGGVYAVNFTATVNRTSTPASTIEIRAVKDGAEVAGSQVGATLTANSVFSEVGNQFLVNVTGGSTIKFQMTATTTAAQIAPVGANATTRPSIRATIHRIF